MVKCVIAGSLSLFHSAFSDCAIPNEGFCEDAANLQTQTHRTDVDLDNMELNEMLATLDVDLSAWGMDYQEAQAAPPVTPYCPEDAADFKPAIFYKTDLMASLKRSSAFCAISSAQQCTPFGNGGPSIPDPVVEALKTGRVQVPEEHRINTVAVVGGGPSGLLSAKFLKEAGVEVVVYEVKGRPGGQADTWIDPLTGFAHDMATKWIPTVTARAGAKDGEHFIVGPPPIQRQIIDELHPLGLREQLSGGFMILDTKTHKDFKMTPVFQKFSVLKLAGDFVHGINILFELAKCPGVHGAVDCGLAVPGETVEEWGERLGIEAFMEALSEKDDALGNGLAREQFVGYALKSRGYFMLVGLVQTLAGFGVFEDTAKGRALRSALPPMGSWANDLIKGTILSDIQAAKGTYMFKQGYSGFWKFFVEKYDLDVRLNTTVTSVSGHPGRMEVQLASGETATFDHVFVATAPAAAKEFLPEQFSPFWDNIRAEGVETIAWRSPSRLNIEVKQPNIALYPEICESNLGGKFGAFMNGVPYAVAYEYADQHDDVYVTIGFPSPDGTNSHAKSLGKLGLTDLTPEYEHHAYWPQVAMGTDYNDFMQFMDHHQGKDGLTFVGEELGGNNVASLMEHVASIFITRSWL